LIHIWENEMGRWDGIDEFVAVATHGSFAAAATALGLSRSHMSRAVAELEDRLQVLLLRTTRKVRLTASGEVFLRMLAACYPTGMKSSP
jgi:DNA-binding transcriptional LysR family regulator